MATATKGTRVKCDGAGRRVHSGLCRSCGRAFPKGPVSTVLPTHYVAAKAAA